MADLPSLGKDGSRFRRVCCRSGEFGQFSNLWNWERELLTLRVEALRFCPFLGAYQNEPGFGYWNKIACSLACKLLKTWWPGTESNRRRQPFQGCALPTELPGRGNFSLSIGLRFLQ